MKGLQFQHPQPVKTRTLASSNYSKAFLAFKQRLNKLKYFPTEYIFKATEELIRSHIGVTRPESDWLTSYNKIVDQMRGMQEKNNYDPASVGETAEFLWTSAKSVVPGKRLYSIINEIIREDDPTVIIHAVVLSCGINTRRCIHDRTSMSPLFNAPIKLVEYPRKCSIKVDSTWLV